MSSSCIHSVSAYRRLILTALVLFAADQVTKTWIYHSLPLDSYFPPDWVPVIDGFFYIVHIGNEGAAWGMLTGYSGYLALFAVLALFAIYKFRHTLDLHQRGMQYAFGLLIGGVLGNLVDRLLHGHVIDFIDVHLPFTLPWVLEGGRWPAFNIADCGITVGVACYVLLSLFQTTSGTAEAPTRTNSKTP